MSKDYIGRAKIELHNIHTGRTDKIEHGNVFKGENIQKYLRTYGCFGNSFADMTMPLYQDVIGGILLFDNIIPNESNIVPAGVGMTANGVYGITNSSTPVEMGSYNDVESSISSDGNTITMVYDWNTSQGNGTINAVALTSYLAGLIGIGNESGISRAGNVSLLSRRSPRYNNRSGSFCCGNKQVKVTSVTSSVASFSVKHLWSINAVLDFNVENIEVSLPTKSFTISSYSVVQMSRNKLVIIYGGAINNGGTLYIDEINTDTWTATARNVLNTTGNQIGGSGDLATGWGSISETELFVTNRTTLKHYAMDIVNGTFEQLPMEDFAGGWASNNHICIRLTDNRILINGDLLGVANTTYMWDRSKGTLRIVNMGNSMAYTSNAIYDNTVGGLLTYTSGQIANNPFYLATINNLENPVTKDVSKTMKVIYTLTKAS